MHTIPSRWTRLGKCDSNVGDGETMKLTIGLLIFICVTAVTVHLAATKKIDTPLAGVLLFFAIASGFITANYDVISRFKATKDGIEVETALNQIDEAKLSALSEIKKDVDAHKESIRLLVANANDTAKKLEEQKGSLSELIQTADELIDKTSDIYRLPDGRTRMGSAISGNPTVLLEKLKEHDEQIKNKDFQGAYATIKECVKIYEESKDKEDGVAMKTGGSLTPDGIAMIYGAASEHALRASDKEQALPWARKAHEASSSPRSKALLVRVLMGCGQLEEAQKLADDTLKTESKESSEFRSILVQAGILKNQSPTNESTPTK